MQENKTVQNENSTKLRKKKKMKRNWSARTAKGGRNAKNERYCIWLICDQISFLEVLCLWCFLVPCVNTCSIMLIMLTVFPIEWLFYSASLLSSHLIFVVFEIHNGIWCVFFPRWYQIQWHNCVDIEHWMLYMWKNEHEHYIETIWWKIQHRQWQRSGEPTTTAIILLYKIV